MEERGKPAPPPWNLNPKGTWEKGETQTSATLARRVRVGPLSCRAFGSGISTTNGSQPQPEAQVRGRPTTWPGLGAWLAHRMTCLAHHIIICEDQW